MVKVMKVNFPSRLTFRTPKTFLILSFVAWNSSSEFTDLIIFLKICSLTTNIKKCKEEIINYLLEIALTIRSIHVIFSDLFHKNLT